MLDGRLEDAIALGEQLLERAQLLGMPQFSGITLRGRGRALIYTGSPADTAVLAHPMLRILLLAHMGQHQEAREGLASMWPTYQTETAAVDALAYSAELAGLLESAIDLGDTHVAGLIALSLADCPGATATGPAVSIQRLVAAGYALLGETDQARLHYRQAIEACTRMRFRPELALSRLELAELLLEHYPEERAEALEYLDFAIAEFREMKMQPALERALRRKGLLKA